MSRENVDVIRRMFVAVNAGDFAAATEMFADDVVLAIHGDAGRVAGEGAVGKAGLIRWFTDWFRMFERDYRFEIGEPRADGERVFLDVTHHARGRLSGADVTMESNWVYEFRDGRIVRADGYTE